MTEEEKYQDCSRFKFVCPVENCGRENIVDSAFTSVAPDQASGKVSLGGFRSGERDWGGSVLCGFRSGGRDWGRSVCCVVLGQGKETGVGLCVVWV